MDILRYILSILPLVKPTVMAVEGLVQEGKSGATKKQLAMDALGVSSAVASAADPEIAPQVAAAKQLVSIAIDSIVARNNSTPNGWQPQPTDSTAVASTTAPAASTAASK